MNTILTNTETPPPQWQEETRVEPPHAGEETWEDNPAADCYDDYDGIVVEEEDDNDSTMSPSQRFVLSEQEPYGQLPACSSKSSVRSRKKRHGGLKKIDLQSLNELDQTVASVGKLYQSPRRPGEDDSVSLESHSIATGDGNTIHTQPDLIANMHLILKARKGMASGSQSVHSIQSKSRSSKKSKKKRRTRGASLERAISETILAAAKSEEDAMESLGPHLSASAEDSLLAVETTTASTDFILNDLDQVSAIIESEVTSHSSSGGSGSIAPPSTDTPSDTPRRRHRYSCSPLLPPIASESYMSQEDEDEDEVYNQGIVSVKKDLEPELLEREQQSPEQENSSLTKSQGVDLFTPVTSNESRSLSPDEQDPSSPPYGDHVPDPFKQLDKQGIQSLWEGADPDDAEFQLSRNNQEDELHLSSTYPSNSRSIRPLPSRPRDTSPSTRSARQHSNQNLTEDPDFLDSDEWTTFDENPFSAFDNASIESPNSIADFGGDRHTDFTKVRTWKSSENGWKNPSKVFI